MRNIKLTIWFDGSNYHGFQIQKNAVTVQQRLTEAVHKVTGESAVIVGCGRTDALVHALAYVCNFKTESGLPCDVWVRALNANLPDDIVVKAAQEVPLSFHAQLDAAKKTYVYRLWNAQEPNPFLRRYACHIRPTLDVAAMQAAADVFLGTHDFIGFASSGFTVKTTVRTIYQIRVTKKQQIVSIEITANGFLYNMARIIVGTLIDVGLHKILPQQLEEIIESRDRRRAGATAKPHGLYLKKVTYGRQTGGKEGTGWEN